MPPRLKPKPTALSAEATPAEPAPTGAGPSGVAATVKKRTRATKKIPTVTVSNDDEAGGPVSQQLINLRIYEIMRNWIEHTGW